MLPFLLRYLGFHIFLLSLVFGLLLDKIAAEKQGSVKSVQCYVCEGPECKTDYKSHINTKCLTRKNKTSSYCKWSVSDKGASRECDLIGVGECYVKYFEGGCFNSDDNSDAYKKFTKCKKAKDNSGAYETGATGRKLYTPKESFGTPCFCKGDLCNNGESNTAEIGSRSVVDSSEEEAEVTGNDDSSGSGKKKNGANGPLRPFNTFQIINIAALGAVFIRRLFVL